LSSLENLSPAGDNREVNEAAAPLAAVREKVEDFLRAAKRPALLEPGEPVIDLRDGNWSLDLRGGRLSLEAWSNDRTVSRRVTAVTVARPGRLELAVERFGKRRGQVFLVDLGRGGSELFERRGERLAFAERFRRFLTRQYPDWRIAELSSEANLEASLSPAYPRALLRKGTAAFAALAAPPDAGSANGALTFGLIWLDYLRSREPKLVIEGLALFLPQGQDRSTCLRLRHLTPRAARFEVFVYARDGCEDRLDTANFGNLDTRLEPCRTACPERAPHLDGWIERLRGLPGLERVERGDGVTSLRIRGLEIARVTDTQMLFGLESKRPARPANLPEIEALVTQLGMRRCPDAADRESPLYRAQPEGWLESQVRANLESIEPSLATAPVYGQVPAFAGGDRSVLDLLAADRSGRLAVLELKASEDIHLPFQALDYWMRVKWHAERCEFSRAGYFPGVELRAEPPRLLLVAPALEFHPKTEVLLRYFAPEIDVVRVGLGVEWRKRPKVMFRIAGAQRPF
jgi:hypothetical protein